jgi:hypothetical protein
MSLSPTQVAQFHQDGYLVLEDVLSPTDLQPVIDEINEAVDAGARRLHAEGELSSLYEEEGFETRLTRITAETERLYWSICSGQLCGPGIFGLLTHPRLLDMAESLLGEELIASSAYRLRPKIPGFAHGVVPWHQDSGYFEPHCDSGLILTMWVALVDATEERGCMQMLPGAHHGPVARHYSNRERRYLEILPADLPAGEVRTEPVRAGGVVLFGNRTPHQSTPNTTDVIRWSMDLRYQSATLPHNFAPLRAPAGEGEPVAACYPPEADFAVRSRKRPESVVQDWQAFQELRKGHVYASLTPRWQPIKV